MAKIQPAQTKLYFAGTVSSMNGKYIDLAQSLSFVNRRKMDQGKIYFLESVKITFASYAENSILGATLSTIPDTWVTRNAWVKGKALWDQMNAKVLEDNPSTQGKWAQYIGFMDKAHNDGGSGSAGPTLNLLPMDSGGNLVNTGEWAVSEYVFPQHVVDVVGAVGTPKAADEATWHMLGDDDGDVTAGTLASAGLVKGYQDTRARVQTAPDVPADMSISWMTLLTDDGSQEPELADIIEAANDSPPYDRDDYAGGAANFSLPVVSLTSITSLYSPEDLSAGFAVPLGMLKLGLNETTKAGSDPANPAVVIELTVAKGHYNGVACTEMRQ